jgi:hypothetical protein
VCFSYVVLLTRARITTTDLVQSKLHIIKKLKRNVREKLLVVVTCEYNLSYMHVHFSSNNHLVAIAILQNGLISRVKNIEKTG